MFNCTIAYNAKALITSCILKKNPNIPFFILFQSKPNNIAVVHSFIRRNTPKKVDPEVGITYLIYQYHSPSEYLIQHPTKMVFIK